MVFEIVDGLLQRFEGSEEQVVIPDGVKMLASDEVFGSSNSTIKSLHLPKSFVGLNSVLYGWERTGREYYFLTEDEGSKISWIGRYFEYGMVDRNNKDPIPVNKFFMGKELHALSAFSVDADNPFYACHEGVLYTKDFSLLLSCPKAKEGDVVVHPDTTSIALLAFEDCDKVTSIELPEGFTTFVDREATYFSNKFYPGLVIIGHGVTSFEHSFSGGSIELARISKTALVFPNLPLIKAPKHIRPMMGIGYCVRPDLFAYGSIASYMAFLRRSKEIVCSLSERMGIQAVVDYYSPKDKGNRSDKGDKTELKQELVYIKAVESCREIKAARKKFKVTSPRQATLLLENMVLNGTADDVRDVLVSQKGFTLTARALGLACRYGGLEKVKRLIDGGASFKWEAPTANNKFFGNFVIINGVAKKVLANYSLLVVLDYFRPPFVGSGKELKLGQSRNIEGHEVLPEAERNKIIGYLKDKGVFNKDDLSSLLMHSILFGCNEIAAFCYEQGGRLKDYETLLTGKRNDWLRHEYVDIVCESNPKALIEMGKQAKREGFSVKVNSCFDLQLFYKDTELMQGLLDHCNITPLTFSDMLTDVITDNNVSAVDVILKSGRLKPGTTLNEYIEHSVNSNSGEVTAKLLDFKNKNTKTSPSSKRRGLSL